MSPDFQISDLIGIPHLRGASTRAGADCWGLGEIAYFEGRGVVLPPLNLAVRGGTLRDSIRALREGLPLEVARAWRKLEKGESPEAYDAVVEGHHIYWVSEDPKLLLSTGPEICSSYLREWPSKVDGVYRYVGGA